MGADRGLPPLRAIHCGWAGLLFHPTALEPSKVVGGVELSVERLLVRWAGASASRHPAHVGDLLAEGELLYGPGIIVREREHWPVGPAVHLVQIPVR